VDHLSWYSAKLRFVVLLEAAGAERLYESVIIFRARGFDDAHARAVGSGRGMEKDYAGGTGERVRWRLVEIVTLDVVQADSLDGAEIHCISLPLTEGESFGFDQIFEPEKSKPHQTI
jgi:hypothetical protein